MGSKKGPLYDGYYSMTNHVPVYFIIKHILSARYYFQGLKEAINLYINGEKCSKHCKHNSVTNSQHTCRLLMVIIMLRQRQTKQDMIVGNRNENR